LRLRVGLYGVAMLAQSMLELLLVVAAIDLLGFGAEGVGWLRAAMALGGVAGGAAAVALLRRGRLSAGVAAGLVLAGVPLALLAAWPAMAPGIVFLVLLGAGYAVFDSALMFLTQRLAPAASLQRVAAVEELVYPLARAAGTGLAAWLVVQYGDTTALVVGAALLPLLALASSRACRSAERRATVPARPVRLLRRVPGLAALPVATIENLASGADRERFDAGGSIDGGFHVIDEGTVELRLDGGPPERLGAGDSFGAAGLLRNGSPSSTASALTPVTAFRIRRADFMARVTPPARGARRAATAPELAPEPSRMSSARE
jgi:MFS family permease